VRDQIRLVVQAGGEFVDVEGTVESRAQLVTVNQQPDFSGLAGKQPCDARIEPPHDGPFGRRAARRAVTDVSDLGEDFAVEQRDPLGGFGFVGETVMRRVMSYA
jgi:hypothetical protein